MPDGSIKKCGLCVRGMFGGAEGSSGCKIGMSGRDVVGNSEKNRQNTADLVEVSSNPAPNCFRCVSSVMRKVSSAWIYD